jgi:predicted RNase H-like HicB family nuclease
VGWNKDEDTDLRQERTIIFERGDEGGWIATIPEVPGAFSQGQTKGEARENVLDALSELMAARREPALSERTSDSETESLSIPPTAP